MTYPNNLDELLGRTAVDTNGDKIGKVGQIYLDDNTGEPVWVTVQTGLFGTKETFAPLANSRTEGDNLVLAVTKDLVKDAPNVDPDGHTSDDENDALYEHYRGYLGAGVGGSGVGAAGGLGTAGREDIGDREYAVAGERDYAAAGDQSLGRATTGGDDAMTRSEERVNVGTQSVEAGRARLRKYVVTENVTQTVPVSHEEVRVEREPITEENRGAAMSGEDISEAEHEVTLRAEEPVVDKETVPVERVRLGTETVTEDQQVSETVRKEQIDEPETR